MVTHSALRDEVDRVAAAVGVRVIHAADPASLTRKSWSAAAAVILDERAAARCGYGALPRRAHVILLTAAAATETTWQTAIGVGAQRVLVLPADERELVRQVAEAVEAARDGGQTSRTTRSGDVIAVVGGCGGAGASLFAAALAQTAGQQGQVLVIDLDPWGGGIDLLIGSENTPGLRWPDLALQSGRLAWSAVRAALPSHPGHVDVLVLSGARRWYEPDNSAVDAVVDAGRRGGATVVCDLPRGLTDAAETALETADLVVLISPCDVRACAASTAIAPRLQAANPNVGLVVRGPSPGGLRAAEIAGITGLPLLASMRAEPRLTDQLEHGGLRLRHRSALAGAARRVLGVLPSRSHPAAGAVRRAAA